MEYGQIVSVSLEGLPRQGVYIGYNPSLGKHIILTRNPSHKEDIIPLQGDSIKEGTKLSVDKALSEAELKFAEKIFGDILK